MKLRKKNVGTEDKSKMASMGDYSDEPKVKEKVKREIDKILEAEIIFLIDEVKWIILIVI